MNCHWLVSLAPFLSLTCAVAAENQRSYYTGAKLDCLRQNLRRHEWAREQRRSLYVQADMWANHPDDRLRALVLPPQVPRAYEVHNGGCPIHGLEINRRQLYDWGLDFARPFKLKCPVGGEEYPSNDFAAYLASGMTDRSLLAGDYADDGWGWRKTGDDRHYWFVAYYAQWSLRKFLIPAISSLGTATVLAEVDDPQRARLYAHKCALLLWQLAAHYPDYLYEKQSREGKEHNPNYRGRLFNMIWEIETPQTCAPAYDAVKPYLAADQELQQLAASTAAEIDQMLRQRLLRVMVTDIMDGSHRIAGNYGTHQNALLALALALDDQEEKPTSQDMVAWILSNQNLTNYQDMGLQDALENIVYRDGLPFESFGYNLGWVQQLTELAASLAEAGVDFFPQRRFQRLLTWPMDILVAGQFWPPLGDSGDMFSYGDCGWLYPRLSRLALPYFRDPRLAEVLREQPAGARDLFSRPVEELLAEFAPQKMDPPGFQSYHLPGYGLAVLQSQSRESRVASVLHYGGWPAHSHADQLNLLLYGFDNALLCDVGYPEQTDSFNWKLAGIWTNTAAHNTVVVDAHRQETRLPGRLHAYEPHGFAQFAEASIEGVYGQVSLYRRACLQVEVAPRQTYVFDVFHVRGGRQHDLFHMGTQADFACTPTLGPVQSAGTLAGPEVPYEQFYDDPTLKDKPLGSVRYSGYRGSGYQFFYNVQRGALSGQAIAEWRLTQPGPAQLQRRPWQGLGLRAHLVGDGEEILAADCKPQGYKHLPPSVKHLIRRRTGDNLTSRFVTVFEPYKDATWIKQVRAASLAPDDGQAVAVLIEMADGSRHYCFHSLNPGREYRLDGQLTVDGQAACLVLDGAGLPLKAMLLNGARLAYGNLTLTGQGLRRSRLTQVDYRQGTMTLADPILGDDLRPGQTLLIAPDGFGASVTLQKVLDARTLSIGDEDLRVGGGPVTDVQPDRNRIVTPITTQAVGILACRPAPGMTVINSHGEPLGRIAAGEPLTLERDGRSPLRLDDFPPGPWGTARRYGIAIAGPGDLVLIPNLTLYERK